MKSATPAPISHLLYLHGFRSSPQSAKARRVNDWVRTQRPDVHWWCPQLPPSPAAAIALLEQGIADWPLVATAVIGSSLGGFYATVLAERLGLRALLLNPAVDPARDLAKHIGETAAWHSDERFFFRAEFAGELRAMTPAASATNQQPTHNRSRNSIADSCQNREGAARSARRGGKHRGNIRGQIAAVSRSSLSMGFRLRRDEIVRQLELRLGQLVQKPRRVVGPAGASTVQQMEPGQRN